MMWILIGLIFLLVQSAQPKHVPLWRFPSLSDGSHLFFPKDRIYIENRDIDGYRASLPQSDLLRREKLKHVMFNAIEADNLAVMSFLLEASGDDFEHIANFDGFTPFHLAVQRGRHDMVQLFLDDIKHRQASNAIVNVPAQQKLAFPAPLHTATLRQDTAMVRMLLDAGADPNQNNHRWGVPLHYAVGHENLELIEMLLNAGANPNAEDYSRKTPLFRTNRVDVLQYFHDAGADLNTADPRGNTLLHSAVRYGRGLKVVQKLLDLGLDVNLPNSEGETPLHFAALNGDPIQIRLLVDAGADMEAVDHEGRKALDIAREAENEKAAQELIALNTSAEYPKWPRCTGADYVLELGQ